jgi:hypothetical protein
MQIIIHWNSILAFGVWPIQQLQGCIVTSIQSGIIGCLCRLKANETLLAPS